MSQDQDTFRRLGRGGAGNFVPSSPLQDEILKHQESQVQAQTLAKTTSVAPAQAGYSRTGRGGAGNFVESATASSGAGIEPPAATADMAVKAGNRMSKMAGRGGAGNWAGTNVVDAEAVERERTKGKELDRMAAEEVDLGLRMPDKVHQAIGIGKTGR